MVLCRDIEFSGKSTICDMSVTSEYFLKIQYLDKEPFIWAKNLQNIVSVIRPIYEQNSHNSASKTPRDESF